MSTIAPKLDRLALRPKEAAEALGVSERTLRPVVWVGRAEMARPPADPRVRAFCDALAEAVAAAVLRDLGCGSVVVSDPRPRANATPGLTTTAYTGGDNG